MQLLVAVCRVVRRLQPDRCQVSPGLRCLVSTEEGVGLNGSPGWAGKEPGYE